MHAKIPHLSSIAIGYVCIQIKRTISLFLSSSFSDVHKMNIDVMELNLNTFASILCTFLLYILRRIKYMQTMRRVYTERIEQQQQHDDPFCVYVRIRSYGWLRAFIFFCTEKYVNFMSAHVACTYYVLAHFIQRRIDRRFYIFFIYVNT